MDAKNGSDEHDWNSEHNLLQRLPSFFVIGPPRTGTSWLHTVLRHRAWLPDPTKETRFFDRHFHRGLDWYSSHFRCAGADRPIGEISPTYFASRDALGRIARLIPQARIVCTFRDPVDRVVSLYRLKRAYGLIPWSFEEALVQDPELLESSRYGTYFQLWRQTFGNSQVIATIYEDMLSDPQPYLDKISSFVSVPRIKLTRQLMSRVLASDSMTQPRNYRLTRGAAMLSEWARAKRLDTLVARAKRLGLLKFFVGGGPGFPEISEQRRQQLYEVFRPEVEKLEGLLNRDLSAWKSLAPANQSNSYEAPAVRTR